MQKLLAQIMKFGVVGVVATVIDFGIMNLLHYGLGLNILIANTSGFIVSLIFNYVASMKYVFAHKEGMSRRREFIIFVVLSVIGLVLNDGIVLDDTSAGIQGSDDSSRYQSVSFCYLHTGNRSLYILAGSSSIPSCACRLSDSL